MARAANKHHLTSQDGQTQRSDLAIQIVDVLRVHHR
jgi:hypothetical protein